jgi:hypothetical protein
LDLIFGHVRPTQRGNVAVSGALGSGKSSLLRMIADPDTAARNGLDPQQHIVLYVDVQAISPFAHEAFWRRVARLLLRDAQQSAAIDPQTAEQLTAPLRQAGSAGIDLVDVEEFLDELADRDIALVLLLDEFEWALNADAPAEAEACRHFLAQMASLARRTPRTLSLVVATVNPLSDALNAVESWRGSPFSTIFTSIVLKPLRRSEAAWLIARAVACGTPPREADKDLLWAASEGQPAVLQAACQALAEAPMAPRCARPCRKRRPERGLRSCRSNARRRAPLRPPPSPWCRQPDCGSTKPAATSWSTDGARTPSLRSSTAC